MPIWIMTWVSYLQVLSRKKIVSTKRKTCFPLATFIFPFWRIVSASFSPLKLIFQVNLRRAFICLKEFSNAILFIQFACVWWPYSTIKWLYIPIFTCNLVLVGLITQNLWWILKTTNILWCSSKSRFQCNWNDWKRRNNEKEILNLPTVTPKTMDFLFNNTCSPPISCNFHCWFSLYCWFGYTSVSFIMVYHLQQAHGIIETLKCPSSLLQHHHQWDHSWITTMVLPGP